MILCKNNTGLDCINTLFSNDHLLGHKKECKLLISRPLIMTKRYRYII